MIYAREIFKRQNVLGVSVAKKRNRIDEMFEIINRKRDPKQ